MASTAYRACTGRSARMHQPCRLSVRHVHATQTVRRLASRFLIAVAPASSSYTDSSSIPLSELGVPPPESPKVGGCMRTLAHSHQRSLTSRQAPVDELERALVLRMAANHFPTPLLAYRSAHPQAPCCPVVRVLSGADDAAVARADAARLATITGMFQAKG